MNRTLLPHTSARVSLPATKLTPRGFRAGPKARASGPAIRPTASRPVGEPAREGETLAVDPSQIPLGSLVYIEELDRYLVAQDTGGAIRRARIDLYMEKVSDALELGVRPVRIQVFPCI